MSDVVGKLSADILLSSWLSWLGLVEVPMPKTKLFKASTKLFWHTL